MRANILILLVFVTHLKAQETIFVLNLYRHGARYPTSQTFTNTSPTYEGQLTPTGMRQHFILGEIMGETYPNLLYPYSTKNIYVRTTNYDRTIASSYSQLQGIYHQMGPNITLGQKNFSNVPYSQAMKLNLENLGLEALLYNAQPVPVNMVNEDYMLNQVGTCPNSDLWEGENFRSNPTFLKALDNLQGLLEYINETFPNIPEIMTKNNQTYWQVLGNLCDTILCNTYNGEPYPNNFDYETYGQAIKFLNDLMNVVEDFGTETQIKIYSGYLLNTVYEYLLNASLGLTQEKFVFFSGHQSTLISVLAALKIISPECMLSNYEGQTELQQCYNPGFASNIQFVLKNYGVFQYKVSLIYNGTQYPLCDSSDGECNLAEFYEKIIEGTGGYGLKQYLEICGVTGNNIENLENVEYISLFSRASQIKDYGILNSSLIVLAIILLALISKNVSFGRKPKRNIDFEYQNFIPPNLYQVYG